MSALIYTLMLFPLIGSLVIFMMPKSRSELFRPIAIFLSIIPFGLCMYLFTNSQSKGSFVNIHTIDWIKSYGISLTFGISGMSLLLLFLTAVLMLLSFLSISKKYSESKGFIGSKIVEILSQEHKCIVVDNHDTYGIMTKEQLNKLYVWRTRNWKAENVSMISGDVLDRLVCLKAFSYNPDIVIHLATYPRAKIVNADPIVGIPKVINTTTNLLWHSEKFSVKKFVYVSSSMIYGDFVDGMKEDGKTKPKNITRLKSYLDKKPNSNSNDKPKRHNSSRTS